VYHSFTNGESWEEVVAADPMNISATGFYTWKRSLTSNQLIGSLIKVVVEPLSNGSTSWADIGRALRPNLDVTDAVFSPTSVDIDSISAETGFSIDGVTTGVELDTVTPANSKGLPVNIISGQDGIPLTITNGSLEVSQATLPAGADSQTFEFTPTTDVIKFRTGGVAGVVVKTVTVTYTDGTKTVISSIVES
jgi:hypothetical protein